MEHHGSEDYQVHGVLHGGSEVPDWVKQTTTTTYELRNPIKAGIDILNKTEGVVVASPFYVNATEVLENETKSILWLQMPGAPWMTKKVEKMNWSCEVVVCYKLFSICDTCSPVWLSCIIVYLIGLLCLFVVLFHICVCSTIWKWHFQLLINFRQLLV